MLVWDAADVAPLSDSKSDIIAYVAVFFPASAALSHLYYVQRTNAYVVTGRWYLSHACFPKMH